MGCGGCLCMRLGIVTEENCLVAQLYLVVWGRRNLHRDSRPSKKKYSQYF